MFNNLVTPKAALAVATAAIAALAIPAMTVGYCLWQLLP